MIEESSDEEETAKPVKSISKPVSNPVGKSKKPAAATAALEESSNSDEDSSSLEEQAVTAAKAKTVQNSS